jgi:putative FmdB family regulatory protein
VPTYDYRCAEGHITEIFAKMSDPPLKKCPECGKKVERVLHAPPIHFKGSGFYSTDYGKGGKKAKPKADAGESKSGDASSGDAKKSDGGDAKKSGASSSAD